MMERNIISLLLLCLAALAAPVTARAQEAKRNREADAASQPRTADNAAAGWYIGVQGGVPFGVSTFSSFGADKTRAGVDAGVYGGYRFTPVLSVELSMKWGKTALSAQDCCIERGYWLGRDGNRYNAPVADMNGWNYADLKSSVSLQSYGAQLNVNVLGFFKSTQRSRWTLEVSPLLAAVGTKATLKTISGNAGVKRDGTRWHLGMGGNLQAGYRITEKLSIGIYSGITYLTGRRMDGAPEYRHRNNFLWESGIRLGWAFGSRGRQLLPHVPATVTPPATLAGESMPSVPVVEQTADTLQPSVLQVETADTLLRFPSVYFGFNSTRITDGQLPKMLEMLDTLLRHPDVRIIITGWCDTQGSKSVNARYSLRRAEALKAWLTHRGIAAARITVRGAGSDCRTPDAAKARRADTTHHNPKEETQR